MVTLFVDAKQKISNVEIEISDWELDKLVKEQMKLWGPMKILMALETAYKESRGLDACAFLRESQSQKYWEYYVNRGSHYSGDEDTDVLITEEDVNFTRAVSTIKQVLTDQERASIQQGLRGPRG